MLGQDIPVAFSLTLLSTQHVLNYYMPSHPNENVSMEKGSHILSTVPDHVQTHPKVYQIEQG